MLEVKFPGPVVLRLPPFKEDKDTVDCLNKLTLAGRKAPVGASTYKVNSCSPKKGIVFEKYNGSKGVRRAPINRIQNI